MRETGVSKADGRAENGEREEKINYFFVLLPHSPRGFASRSLQSLSRQLLEAGRAQLLKHSQDGQGSQIPERVGVDCRVFQLVTTQIPGTSPASSMKERKSVPNPHTHILNGTLILTEVSKGLGGGEGGGEGKGKGEGRVEGGGERGQGYCRLVLSYLVTTVSI